MKKLFIVYLLILTSQIFAQVQDKFIIGVDWINPLYPNPNPSI
ncbi:MAG TPA: hypothetical protein PKA80_04600 [Ignavibacteriaceae bacterium]|nr:hypothetical protein [Ignavibacteriaceae bacterium]HMU65411.1 hypothetical protein [Nitrosomonas sp.]